MDLFLDDRAAFVAHEHRVPPVCQLVVEGQPCGGAIHRWVWVPGTLSRMLDQEGVPRHPVQMARCHWCGDSVWHRRPDGKEGRGSVRLR